MCLIYTTINNIYICEERHTERELTCICIYTRVLVILGEILLHTYTIYVLYMNTYIKGHLVSGLKIVFLIQLSTVTPKYAHIEHRTEREIQAYTY